MSDGVEQYEEAVCPGCGSKLTGSREPGERDYCITAEREVTLQPENKNYRAYPVGPADSRELFEPHHITVKRSIERHRNGERNPPVEFEACTLNSETEQKGGSE